MGIKDFLKIVVGTKTIKEYGHLFDENFIANKKIAVDAFNIIYRARYVIGDSLSVNGRVTSHIKIILNMLMRFKKLNTINIWIFDGAKNELKKECVEKRKIKITNDEVNDIKRLLSLCGIPYFTVNVEAEFFAAELVKKGIVEFVLSSDMDIIIRGGSIIKDEKNGNKKQYFVLQASEFIKEANLTLEKLAKIGVMMGCDFAPKTARVGPKNVIKKLDSTELTDRQQEAYDLFLAPLNKPIMNHEVGEFNEGKLREFLTELQFAEKTINGAIEILILEK